MNTLQQSAILGQRAVREALRSPEGTFPIIFIPLFFLIVNVGQVADVFTSTDTPFLEGQSYAAFQLPNAFLLAASFGMAAVYLVEDIESGYFDKLRATPIARSSLLLGRLAAEAVKGVVITAVLLLVALPFGVRVQSGIIGVLLIIVLSTLWGVVFSSFMQLVAMKTRSPAATQSASMVFFPLLFLTPNVVPREMLTRPMEIAATFNPVTYLMEALRSLILGGVDGTQMARACAVLVGLGALGLWLNVRTINQYD